MASLAVCLLGIASGCGDGEDPRFAALRDRGARFTLNEKGELTGLYLYGDDQHGFGDDDLDFLKDYQSVKLLLIESKKLTDAGLQHVKSLKNLEELDLTLCQGEKDERGNVSGGITNEGLKTLQEISTLKRIGLQATLVTDEGADRLQRAMPMCRVEFNYRDAILATMLQQLTVAIATGREPEGIVDAARKMGAGITYDNDDKLKPIDAKWAFSDLSLFYIGREKTLKSLTLRGDFTGNGLAHLTDLPQLESLDIADPYGRRNIDAADMQTLTSISKLKSLDLSGIQMGDTELQMLGKLTALESLKVIGCGVTDPALRRLKKSLPDCQVEYSNDPLLNELLNRDGDVPAAVGAVANSVEREEGKIVGVEFRLSRISNEGLAELEKLGDLQRLHFVYCRRFTDDGMRSLGQMSKLKSLTLSHTSVGNRGVSRIATLSGLEQLDLSTNRVGVRSGQFIDDGCMRDIAALKALTALSLRGTEISDTGLRRLEVLANLKSLDIRGTRVTEDGLQRIKRKLPDCKVKF